MTTRPGDTPHYTHPHLDDGACLDGSGRRWQPGEASGPFAGPAVTRAPIEVAVARLAREVLLLTFAVVLLAVVAVAHAADHGGIL